MKREIQNFEALAGNDLRRDALAIAEAGYAAINVGATLENGLRIENDELRIGGMAYRLPGRRVFFIGVGKCAFAAAVAVEDILGDRLTGGIALDVSFIEGRAPSKIETYIGTHPLPSEVNENATKRVMEFLSECHEDDLVLMLISGGGSALLCLHEASTTYSDEIILFKELTARGATIRDINTVRKHTSRARGGALAKAAYPAEVVSLIISDIPGDDIAFIASGPTVLDSSTVEDARAVLEKYGVTAPVTIEFLETPKEQKYFKKVTNMLFLTNQNALSAMRDEALRRGYTATIIDDHFAGEASAFGRTIVEKLHSAPTRTALLYAGESTVTLSSARHGAGGRNQEMALAALNDLHEDELILPFASDGHDNTDHAGAIGDSTTRAHALMRKLSIAEYLDDHRAYDFFTATGDALVTGYTGSNVSDLIIALKK